LFSLLIAPEGIEMRFGKVFVVVCPFPLLIAPEGIEITCSATRFGATIKLLIAPEGIEI